MKLVITMSRRFGTGASMIAQELSERLGIPVYDKVYIEQKLGEHEYETEAEAIRKLEVKDFPVIVVIDSEGNNLYETAIKQYQN